MEHDVISPSMLLFLLYNTRHLKEDNRMYLKAVHYNKPVTLTTPLNLAYFSLRAHLILVALRKMTQPFSREVTIGVGVGVAGLVIVIVIVVLLCKLCKVKRKTSQDSGASNAHTK